MHNPPKGKPLEGRFNHSGQSHLYLSNNLNTAIKEVVGLNRTQLVWTQEFSIEKEIKNILDLSFNWENLTPSTSAMLLSLKLNNSIDRTDRNKENWRPDYYMTRYIMDCAKELEYSGIKYNSTKDLYEFDLVLFHPQQVGLKSIGRPKIQIFKKEEEEDGRNFESDLFDT